MPLMRLRYLWSVSDTAIGTASLGTARHMQHLFLRKGFLKFRRNFEITPEGKQTSFHTFLL